MIQVSLEQRNCPICGRRDASRLFALPNVRVEALDRYAFASRKTPEYTHWRLSQCPELYPHLIIDRSTHSN